MLPCFLVVNSTTIALNSHDHLPKPRLNTPRAVMMSHDHKPASSKGFGKTATPKNSVPGFAIITCFPTLKNWKPLNHQGRIVCQSLGLMFSCNKVLMINPEFGCRTKKPTNLSGVPGACMTSFNFFGGLIRLKS